MKGPQISGAMWANNVQLLAHWVDNLCCYFHLFVNEVGSVFSLSDVIVCFDEPIRCGAFITSLALNNGQRRSVLNMFN